MKANLSNADFNNIFDVLHITSIRVGKIINVERIPKNKKMIKITVEFANNINKTVISNIGGNMKDVTLLINNIEPVEKNGHLSEAIIVADINENNFDFESGFTVTN